MAQTASPQRSPLDQGASQQKNLYVELLFFVYKLPQFYKTQRKHLSLLLYF